MTTNREWLYSLSGYDLVRWLDAEHDDDAPHVKEGVFYYCWGSDGKLHETEMEVHDMPAPKYHAEKVWCDCDCCGWQQEKEDMQKMLDQALADVAAYGKEHEDLWDQLDEKRGQVANLEARVEELERELCDPERVARDLREAVKKGKRGAFESAGAYYARLEEIARRVEGLR